MRPKRGHADITLRMQAQTAARFEDVLAHVTFMARDARVARTRAVWYPCGTRPEYGIRGTSHPRNGRGRLRVPQQTSRCQRSGRTVE